MPKTLKSTEEISRTTMSTGFPAQPLVSLGSRVLLIQEPGLADLVHVDPGAIIIIRASINQKKHHLLDIMVVLMCLLGLYEINSNSQTEMSSSPRSLG
ncbi:hypothetical protein PoB_000167300 [Plakobranchus ocellatus]|uniref:Uncharacterized protein n=1 Tax=Plakobranchus ocellatus TaxID=259542 RepID=A0AAV3XXT3_9GAST|nr:hypothetical protein PoB_000167300 [Plakobranchus ocellatus]